MRTEVVSFENRTLEVRPPATHHHGDDVAEVIAVPNYALHVRFFDGVSGEVHLKSMIFSETAGVFAALRDPELFRQVGVTLGAVTWANGLDLAPDAMHAELQANGGWRLT